MADKNRHNRGKLDRRQMLKYSALGSGLVGAGLPFISVTGSSPLVASNQIIEENRKRGTTDWQLTYVRSQNYRSPDIEGYCSRTSVRPGESLDIFVSASTDTDRKSTRLNSSHVAISYAVFCLKKKKTYTYYAITNVHQS